MKGTVGEVGTHNNATRWEKLAWGLFWITLIMQLLFLLLQTAKLFFTSLQITADDALE